MATEKRLSWRSNCKGDDKASYEWIATNQKGEDVGLLEYEHCGRFMHWIWYQTPAFGMSPGCLDEVREKTKELYDLKKVDQ